MPMFSFQQDLTQYLLSRGLIDEILPTTPDIADKWQQIAEAYLPDGIREFALYPTAALGWMMYIGMAIANPSLTGIIIFHKFSVCFEGFRFAKYLIISRSVF